MFKDYPYEILIKVRKPSRYLGEEPGFTKKSWEDNNLRIVFVYPDLYEIGRSHLGINILTWIVNNQPDTLADYAFCVAPDMEKALKEKRYPLLSCNYRKPLKDFSAIGISYAYELLVTNILQVLDLSGIPFRSEDRGDDCPIVFGGGPSCGNPEPIADFFDFFIIGEAEELILEVLPLLRAYTSKDLDKENFLKELVKLEGVYVPRFKNKVKRRVFLEFFTDKVLWTFPTPVIPLSHDRIPLEISRGCTRGCRFCEASFYYRPVREKPPELLVKHLEENFKSSGYREASLMSLSAGDYTCLKELIRLLWKTFYAKGGRTYNFSLPSLRVGSIDEEVLEFIKFGRKSGLTFAPEAGTDRLRRVINKDIDIDQLFKDASLAFSQGWKKVKLYFMIGLPTETQEDLEGIVKLCKELRRSVPGLEVTASASTFIPKSHTPFQWEAQIGIDEAYARAKWIKKRLKRAFKYHDPKQSFLEGVIARGDRVLSKVVERAYLLGARLDSWSEYFDLDLWIKAAEKEGVDLERYLKSRSLSEPLPWEHIDLRVKKDFLLKERQKAYEGKLTRDCRFFKCSNCGACDSKVKNFLTKEKESKTTPFTPKEIQLSTSFKDEFWCLFWYSKVRKAAFLSQLEVMRLFQLTFQKLGLPLAYTEGFHPHPKVVTPDAISVGIDSQKEWIAFAFTRIGWEDEVLNKELYPGLKILKVEVQKDKPKTKKGRSTYLIECLGEHELKEIVSGEVSCTKLQTGYWKVELQGHSISKILKELTGLSNPLIQFKVTKLA